MARLTVKYELVLKNRKIDRDTNIFMYFLRGVLPFLIQ